MQPPAGKTPSREAVDGSTEGEPLILVGASVRAAAASARRAGFVPIGVDRFGDADLVALCELTRCYERPLQLVGILNSLPRGAWMYTGSLENHPGVVQRISATRELLGNPAAALQDVRDLAKLQAALRADGLLIPESRNGTAPPSFGEWLRKPRRSGGGLGITRGDAPLAVRGSHYWQQFVAGRSCGALFVAAGGEAILLGVTEQLLGPDWGGATEFQYCGSIGPIPLSDLQRKRLECIGNCLARQFRLVGLFGVDIVLHDDEAWVIEVNPRYTASVEILERALTVQAIRLHVDACRGGVLPVAPSVAKPTYCAKAILYARRCLTIEAEHELSLWELNAASTWPCVADIPPRGSVVQAGSPVVTVLTNGESSEDVQLQLHERLASLRATLEA